LLNKPVCLGLTKHGEPSHPLYVSLKLGGDGSHHRVIEESNGPWPLLRHLEFTTARVQLWLFAANRTVTATSPTLASTRRLKHPQPDQESRASTCWVRAHG
jgi:hypothetical protein